MRGGVVTFWAMFVFGAAGTLFPDLFARHWLDDRRLVRMLAVPLTLASSALLVSHHTRWF